MIAYVKYALWDAILVFAAAMSLNYIALDCFYVSPALQYGPVPALVALVCTLALFLIAKNRGTARIGSIVYAAVIVVVWVVSGVLTPGGQIFEDDESNYLIFTMVTTLVPTVCFLVSRKRAGAAVLFIGGVFIIAITELLYARFELAWTIVFLVAVLALVIFKNYQQCLANATTVRKATMLPGFCVALAAVVLAVGVGVGVWYGIIAPMDPGAVQIKLVTEYRSLETKQVIGTSNIFQEPNTDMTSNNTNDSVRTTDDIQEGEDGVKWPATGKEEEPDDQDLQNTFLGINIDSLQDAFDFQQNPSVRPLMISILLLIVLAIVAYFVGRRAWRKRRLEKLRAQGAAAEYEGLFLFLIERFKRLGITVPKGQTVLEFGHHADNAVGVFNHEAGVAFSDLTADYSALVYGKRELDERSLKNIESYYLAFYKAAREYLGSVKYFFKSFRL